MRKLSVWMLVIAFVLGIGFAAGATDLNCEPVRPPCAGNLDTFKKTVDVNLHVAPWVELFFINGSVMNLCYPEPGKPLVGDPFDIKFQGRSNVPLRLNFASEGFDNDIIDGSLKYYVFMFGGWEWPLPDIGLDGFQYLLPGGSKTVGPALKGKWHGHVKAEGSWPYNDWENLDAGSYSDVVIITVADAS